MCAFFELISRCARLASEILNLICFPPHFPTFQIRKFSYELICCTGCGKTTKIQDVMRILFYTKKKTCFGTECCTFVQVLPMVCLFYLGVPTKSLPLFCTFHLIFILGVQLRFLWAIEARIFQKLIEKSTMISFDCFLCRFWKAQINYDPIWCRFNLNFLRVKDVFYLLEPKLHECPSFSSKLIWSLLE